MSNKTIVWDKAAEEKMENVPFFIRKMVRKKIELTAQELGETTITVELVDKVKTQKMAK